MTRSATASTAVAAAALLAVSCGFGFGSRRITGLASAAREGDVASIDALLDAGARIDEPAGVNDWPPLMHAVHKHQVAAARRLLERGASLDGSVGHRALFMASGYGDREMVALLLAHGVQPTSGTLGAAVGGAWDLDYRWTGCDRHTDVTRVLLQKNPRLRLGHAPGDQVARWYAGWKGCDELLRLVR